MVSHCVSTGVGTVGYGGRRTLARSSSPVIMIFCICGPFTVGRSNVRSWTRGHLCSRYRILLVLNSGAVVAKMAGVEVSSKSMMASTVASSSTLSSRPTNTWRVAAQDLAGDPGGSATKHPTCRQLGGQARGTERQHPLPPASGGLADLATVLGKRAENRDALLAVVAALARVGITEALDLSFLGSGDVLPSETVAEILKDCAVHGADEALKHMFRIARDGMEGSVSLMLWHLGPTRRALQSLR